ncbi:MAG: ZIP family metal transporter, partial [Candidatus Bathyarchaeia archaeon]
LLFPFAENLDMFILPFAAGGFIYIASSDLIPELHREADLGRASISFVFFVAGILLMAIIKLIFQH